MSAFIYFLPELQKIQSRQLQLIPEDTGLRKILDKSSWSYSSCAKGPGDLSGAMISVHPSPGSGGTESPCLYQPELQKWLPVESESGKITHYIGWQTATPPTPQDLVRETVIEGEDLVLNEKTWTIPIIEASRTTLPLSFKCTGKGMKFVVDPIYNSIQQQTEIFWTLMHGGDGSFPDYFTCYRYCCELLKMNYRVGDWEISSDCLDILRTTTILDVIKAACGVMAIDRENESLKKSITAPVT